MALARCHLVVQSEVGDLVDGATLTVTNEETSSLEPVFSNRAGSASLGNPFVAADGADAGFYVAGGSYRIDAVLGGFTRTWRHVAVGTAAEQDYYSVAYYDTKADVEAANIPDYITHVRIAGYNDINDGGDATYEVVGSEPSHGGKIQSNNNVWLEISRANRVYRIEQFGGGTGVANNKTAWDIFLTVLGSDSGMLLFGAGVYTSTERWTVTLSATHNNRIAIRGLGQAISILKWTNASGGIQITKNTFRNTYSIIGLGFATTQNGGGTAIDIVQNSLLDNGMNNFISDVCIRGDDAFTANTRNNYWTTGISVFNDAFTNYHNIHLWGPTGNLGTGIVVEGTNDTTQSSVVHNLMQCMFWNMNIGFLHGDHAQGITFSQCNFFGNVAGIVVEGDGDVQLHATGCCFENTYGIDLNDAGVADGMISGNVFYIGANCVGIEVGGGQRYTINGNCFTGTSTTNSHGVHAVANAAGNIGIITGNTYQTLAAGNLFDVGTSGWSVQSNVYTNNTANNTNNAGGSNTIGGGSA